MEDREANSWGDGGENLGRCWDIGEDGVGKDLSGDAILGWDCL